MTPVETFLPGILLAYGVVFVGILSPGPNIMTVIGTAMSVGRREARWMACGIACGSLLWAFLAWYGLVTIISRCAAVMTALKLFGAAYLLWLGIKAFRSAARSQAPAVAAAFPMRNARSHMLRGLLVQMTNPKAALSWIAVMTLGLRADAPLWVGAAIVGGTTLISLGGHLTYAIAFSTAPMVAAYRRARRIIETALGGFFCFASYRLANSTV